MKTSRRSFINKTTAFGLVGGGAFILNVLSHAKEKKEMTHFKLTRRLRKKKPLTDAFVEQIENIEIEIGRTALIICDMWDLHHCKNAVDRVTQLAPRIDKLAKHLREVGCQIIHAPSSCMKYYESHAARHRVSSVPTFETAPKDIGQWCHWMPDGEEEKNYPIDQSDGGCDSDPVQQKKFRQHLIDLGKNPGAPWTHQIKAIHIDEKKDYISDDGVEIWNIMEHHDISNVLLVGVHTNMCVLGRPFGLRQMAKNKKNVHLIRDLTDTMYNPQSAPFVDHHEGTHLIIEHIEKYVCPTVSSDQFLGGEAFKFIAL